MCSTSKCQNTLIEQSLILSVFINIKLVLLYWLHHHNIITGLSANDSSWYQTVTGKLTADQIELLQSLMVYTEQRRAQTGQLL